MCSPDVMPVRLPSRSMPSVCCAAVRVPSHESAHAPPQWPHAVMTSEGVGAAEGATASCSVYPAHGVRAFLAASPPFLPPYNQYPVEARAQRSTFAMAGAYPGPSCR